MVSCLAVARRQETQRTYELTPNSFLLHFIQCRLLYIIHQYCTLTTDARVDSKFGMLLTKSLVMMGEMLRSGYFYLCLYLVVSIAVSSVSASPLALALPQAVTADIAPSQSPLPGSGCMGTFPAGGGVFGIAVMNISSPSSPSSAGGSEDAAGIRRSRRRRRRDEGE